MIHHCRTEDFEQIWFTINDGATAYKGVIPDDCWSEPYMSRDYLQKEIDAGVVFAGYYESGELVGVMGLQLIQDVTLIRHAYVRSSHQGKGIGAALLAYLTQQTQSPILIGTWADALWAIRFYKRHGFQITDPVEKDQLLRKYWKISDRQIETSVVLVTAAWHRQQRM